MLGSEPSSYDSELVSVKAIDVWFVIRKYAQKIIRYYQSKGFWKTLLRSLVWVSYRKDENLFFEIDLLAFSPPKDLKESGDFAAATATDVEEIPDYFDGWFNKRQALRRLEQGPRLFLIRKEQRAVSFLWLEFGTVFIPALDLSFTVPDTTAYIAYTYTLPERRKDGVAYLAQNCALEYLKNRGYRTAFLMISPVNETPIRMVKRSGFKLFQVVFYQRFFFLLRHYRVRDPDTDREKSFWHLSKSDHEVWKTFSKSCQA